MWSELPYAAAIEDFDIAMNESKQHSKRVVRLLGVAAIVMFVLAAVFAIRSITLQVKLSIAAGQISLLIEREEYARESRDPKEIVSVLTAAARPSAWEDGSALGIIMGLIRSNVVSNIRTILVQRTGVDYGNNFIEWQKRFGSNPEPTNTPR